MNSSSNDIEGSDDYKKNLAKGYQKDFESNNLSKTIANDVSLIFNKKQIDFSIISKESSWKIDSLTTDNDKNKTL